MPLYEYRCAQCGHTMQVLEKADVNGRHRCEKCGSRRVKKLMSGFSVGTSSLSSSGGSCPTGTCPLS